MTNDAPAQATLVETITAVLRRTEFKRHMGMGKEDAHTAATAIVAAIAPAQASVEAVREALLGYVLKPGQYETASSFARGQNRVAVDMLAVLDAPPQPVQGVEAHKLTDRMSCEFDDNCYTITWSDGHWLTAKDDGTVFFGTSPGRSGTPPQKSSVSALLTPAAEPVAWMDDGSTRAGSHGTAYRVVTAATLAAMPKAAAEAYKTPLYAAPPAPAPEAGELENDDGR